MDNQLHNHNSHFLLERFLPQTLLLCLALFFLPTVIDLSSEWVQWDQSLAHAYPLLLGFALLLYRASPLSIARQHWLVDVGLAALLIASSVLWLLFHFIQIKILEQLILLPILYCMIAFVFGMKTLWRLRFLLIMPLFVLPVWDYLNNPLIELSSIVVGEMVRAIKIPALIDGSSIFIPAGHIMIADGCSGLRYLIISLALGYTISYLNGYKEKGLALSLLIAAILGLIANWLRIFILILIGYYSEMESSLMQDHEIFGWILFSAICFPAIYFAPVVKQAHLVVSAASAPLPLKKLLLLPLLLAPGSAVSYLFTFDKPVVPHEYTISSAVWQQTLAALPLPLSLPLAQKKRRYSDQNNIHLQIDQYQPLSRRQRLVPYIPRQYDAQYWILEKSELVSQQDKTVRVDIFRFKSGLKKIVQVQWFDVGGRKVARVAQAKLLQIPAVINSQYYFSIFTLQLPCRESACQQELQKILSASEKFY